MKKLITIFILCFLTGIATVHAAYQRHQKQPNFFMPAGAMRDTVNKPIALPRQTIRQKPAQNKAPQISKNNLKTQTPKKPIKQAESKKNAAPQVQTAAENPAKSENVNSAENIAPNPLKATETTENLPITPLLQEKSSTKIKKNQFETMQTPPIIAQNTPIINEKTKTNTPEQNAYTQSFEEYDADLQAIADGKTGFNPRLQKMLADFKNQEHKISFSVK